MAKGVRQWRWDQFGAGVGVVVAGLVMIQLGLELVAAVAILIGGGIALASYRPVPQIELEANWRAELGEFRNGLQRFSEMVAATYRDFRRQEGEDAPTAWEDAVRRAHWPPGVPPERDLPLCDWKDRYYSQASPESALVFRLAETIYPPNAEQRPPGTTDLRVLDPFRRQAVAMFAQYSDRLEQHVAGFGDFLDSHTVKVNYRHVVLLLAYLQVALAIRSQERRPPRADRAFWKLGREWCG